MRLPATVIFVLAASAFVAAQVIRAPLPAPGTATAKLSGRVTATDTGAVIRNAFVTVRSSAMNGDSYTTYTDDQGRWDVGALPAGSYSLAVGKAGYVSTQYGQRRDVGPATFLELKVGQAIEKLNLALTPGGIISGRIVDEFGDPVTGAIAVAHQYRYVDGDRQIRPIGGGSMLSSLAQGGFADDRGQFRIHGLRPGEYFVSAELGGQLSAGNSPTYGTTFYPGTPSAANALPVTVRAGAETTVTFALARVRLARVSGRVMLMAGSNPAAGPGTPAGFTVALSPPSQHGLGELAITADLRVGGTFTFRSVPPGDYILRAWTGGARGSTTAPGYGAMPLTITNGDLTDVVMDLQPGGSASGHVRRDDGSPVPTGGPAGRLRTVTPNAAEAVRLTGFGDGVLNPDGTFELTGLFGRQLIRFGLPNPNAPATQWYLKSVTIGGRDVTDAGYDFPLDQKVPGIDVLLTQTMASVTGVAQDANGAAVDAYSVVVFSTDTKKWTYATRFVRAADSDPGGRFEIRGLPADDYFVVALKDYEPGEETDPETLSKWRPQAIRVTLGDGETKPIALRVSAP